MDEVAGLFRRPLPKGLEGYAGGRLFEALAEAVIALRLLEMGLDRNAAGKAFQAWKSLLAAYAAAEFEKLASRDPDWWGKAVYEMPTGRMKPISQELERLGLEISAWTDKALLLHEYQYNGPDPDLMFSQYPIAASAVYDVVKVAKAVRDLALRLKQAWSDAAEKALRELEDLLTKAEATLATLQLIR